MRMKGQRPPIQSEKLHRGGPLTKDASNARDNKILSHLAKGGELHGLAPELGITHASLLAYTRSLRKSRGCATIVQLVVEYALGKYQSAFHSMKEAVRLLED